MEIDNREPTAVLSRLTKIVMMSMALALLCISVVVVIVAYNARSTQNTADFFIRQNQELQDELQCLRPAALAYDTAQGNSQIHLAEGLAEIAEGNRVPVNLGVDLREDADNMQKAIKLREQSVQDCSNQP